jgi:hypothetical protein
MSIKASKLKSNESQKVSLNKEINAILGHIDDSLKVAYEQGKHNISLTIPITFSIPYMLNKDAQRHIYHGILKSLIDREFTPSLELQDNASVLHITWLSEDEEKDIEIQNSLIAKYSKKM